jgi:hypothetical protein
MVGRVQKLRFKSAKFEKPERQNDDERTHAFKDKNQKRGAPACKDHTGFRFCRILQAGRNRPLVIPAIRHKSSRDFAGISG